MGIAAAPAAVWRAPRRTRTRAAILGGESFSLRLPWAARARTTAPGAGALPQPHGLIPDESEGAGRSCNPQPGRLRYFRSANTSTR
jgi:hypothetical protein